MLRTTRINPPLSRTLTSAAFACLLCALPACKIVQYAEPGGKILSSSGAANCPPATSCEIDVENGSVYSETFTAVPEAGHVFVGWREGAGMLCGGSLEPCEIRDVPGRFTNNDREVFLEAQFEPAGDGGIAIEVDGLDESVIVTASGYTYSIHSNGRFSAGGIPRGLSYDFSISRQPQNQVCQMFDGKGIVSSRQRNVVYVDCRYPSSPHEIRRPESARVPFNKAIRYELDILNVDQDPLEVTWKVISGPANGDLKITPGGRDNVAVMRGSVLGLYRVRVTLTDGNHTAEELISVWVRNMSPNLPTFSLYPPAPHPSDSIRVARNGELSDPEGVDLAISATWTVNGKPVADVDGLELPPGTAEEGDEVAVTLVISDGVNDLEARVKPVTLVDGPLDVEVVGLDSYVEYGETVSLAVLGRDPDDDVEVELAYGPETMSLSEDGRLEWDVKSIMFGPSQYVHFGLRNKLKPEDLVEFSVEVKDPARKLPIARSSAYSSSLDGNITIGQFDADPAPEILTTDGYNRIMIVEFDGHGFRQEWMYPFSVHGEDRDAFDRVRVLGADIDADGLKEILALTEMGLYYIEDLESPAVQLFEYNGETRELLDIDVANLDDDAALEVVLLSVHGLFVLDAQSGETLLSIEYPWMSGPLAVGNVDGDAALEAVLGDGTVFDLSTGTLEWTHEGGFGESLALMDNDGSGIHKILGNFKELNRARFTSGVSLFDANDRSVLWVLKEFQACSVSAAHFDADKAHELIVGGCDDTIQVYEVSNSGLTEVLTVAAEQRGAYATAFGDVDGDRAADLVYGTRASSSLADKLTVARSIGGDVSFHSGGDPLHLGGFAAAGAFPAETGDWRAVFVVPNAKTLLRRAAQYLATVDAAGNVKLSDRVSGNLHELFQGVVRDYDKDGQDEVIFANASFRAGIQLQVRGLPDFSFEWDGPALGNFGEMLDLDVADFNGDGRDDALITFSRGVVVKDISSGAEIWSQGLPSTQGGAAAGDLDGDGIPELVTNTSRAKADLRVWQWAGSNYVERHNLELRSRCIDVAVVDVADLPGGQVVCLGYATGKRTFLRIYGAGLELEREFELPFGATGLAAQSGGQPKRSVMISGGVDPWGRNDSFVTRVSLVSGQEIWRSPLLLGSIPRGSLHSFVGEDGNPGLVIGTRSAMFLTR